MAFLNPAEFALEVSKGNITGHSRISVSGKNSNVSATETTLWEENIDYVFPSSASTMTVSSDSASDAAAGVGATLVLVEGLDASYDKITETIDPNGTTGTTTSNSYLRVNRLTVVTTGTSTFNVGTIYMGTGGLTAGKPANVFNLIGAEVGISMTGVFTTPNSFYVAIVNTNSTVDSIKIVNSILCTHLENGTRICGSSALIETSLNLAFTWASSLIGPKIDVELRSSTDAGLAVASVNLGLVEIDSTLTTVTV